LGFYFYFHL